MGGKGRGTCGYRKGHRRASRAQKSTLSTPTSSSEDKAAFSLYSTTDHSLLDVRKGRYHETSPNCDVSVKSIVMTGADHTKITPSALVQGVLRSRETNPRSVGAAIVQRIVASCPLLRPFYSLILPPTLVSLFAGPRSRTRMALFSLAAR